MFTVRKLILLSLSLLLVGTLSLSVPHPQEAQAQATTITYNLYATDGYISLADGTQVYNYGFIGGRANQPVMYQNSVKAPPGAPKTYVPGGLVTTATPGTLCTGNWPTPTGGPIAAGCEAQLAGNAQFPAPIIYAATGDVVEIRLKNLGVTNRAAPNDPHSIHLHGLDVNAANDGVPETSLGAVPANAAMPGAGNVVVYMFTPQQPGTYMYHCHQEADIHVQMGMYGALVVYSAADAANPSSAYNLGGPGQGQGDLWGWRYDRDYVLLLSEFDVLQHKAEQLGGAAGAYNPVNFKPQYWFINGLSFPNTIHAAAGVVPFSWATWIAAHPGYDPFIVGSVSAPSVAGTPGEKVLLRVINMGFQTQPMHMHGFHGTILGSDQHPWSWTGGGLQKNTLTIGSGETYEWLLDFGTWNGHVFDYYPGGPGSTSPGLNGTFPGGTQSKMTALGAPVSNTDPNGVPIPDPFAPPFTYIGGPKVGPVAQDPPYATNQDLSSEAAKLAGGGGANPPVFIRGQLFPFHNHDDYKATNNGIYPGGMFTMIMTAP